MEIETLKKEGREIWKEKQKLEEIIPCMGKVFGDVCKWQRNAPKDKGEHNQEELKKELGNFIFSTIRWCDDLGFNPEECIELAKKAQRKFEKN